MDIFAAAGLKKPDLSILSDEFLTEVRGMPQRNLAVELLQKLLKGEIKARSRRNVVQARSFADRARTGCAAERGMGHSVILGYARNARRPHGHWPAGQMCG